MKYPSKKLGEMAEINPRRPILTRADHCLTTFVPMDAVDEVHGRIVRSRTEPFEKVRRGYTYFEEGDVIFAKITPCMQNGKHAVARNLIDGIGFGSTEFHVVRAGSEMLPEWIHSFLRMQSTISAAQRTFRGAVGQQRVPEFFLQEILIPSPPIDIQRQLVELLEQQLALVESAREAATIQMREIEILPEKILSTLFES